MIIDKIQYNEKKSIFEIHIDDEKYMVSYELYNSLNLKSGIDISFDIYNAILKEHNYQIAKKIAENYISYKQRSELETRLKIRTKIDDIDVENKVINYYKKLNLLDDKRYAKEYIDYLLNIKHYSLSYTIFKLKSKGIKSNIYNDLIDDVDYDIELRNIKYLYEKKYKNKIFNDYKEKQKAFRYFAGKGFKFDEINRVLEEYDD